MNTPHLRLIKTQHTLLYGISILPNQLLHLPHHRLTIPLPEKQHHHLTIHSINGDKAQLQSQLQQSLHAFFDIYAENLG